MNPIVIFGMHFLSLMFLVGMAGSFIVLVSVIIGLIGDREELLDE